MNKTCTFENLGLSEKTLAAITKKGFIKPSPVQEQVIPIVLNKKCDLIAQAQTGTGKTGAFAIPLINQLQPSKQVQVIILTPTRELAIQVCSEINDLKGSNPLKSLPILRRKTHKPTTLRP